jgi:CTP:molybdopterin cytidylyltransferase MocA
MGGSKARLLIGGETLTALHVRRLREAGCASVIVVLRAEDVSIAGDAIVAISSAPDPAGSLRVGLAAAPKAITIVTPVDVLPAKIETIRALAHALDDAAIEAATPTFKGVGGHPIAARHEVLNRVGSQTLRDVLGDLGNHRVRIEVDDPAVTTDLDDPAALLALTGAPPAFAR